jgi:hypothetical protein
VVSTAGFRRRFVVHTTLLYRSYSLDVSSEENTPGLLIGTRSFGTELEPRYIIRAESLDQ